MNGCIEPKCRPESGCDLGEELKNCPNWRASASSSSTNNTVDEDHHASALPWSGNVLGMEGLSFVTSRSSPFNVALVGPFNSGKTTLLAHWYLLASQGHSPHDLTFAGSYTLGGWENISHRLRWSSDAGPTFPLHTPVGGRTPGMLHMAYRGRGLPSLQDFIFIDAPGEWYKRWSIDQDAPNAEGARWIAEAADAFLVLADCDALVGEHRGAARQTMLDLFDRIGSVRHGRPVALVWTKSDKEPSNEMKAAIQDAARLAAATFSEFAVSIYPAADQPLVASRFIAVLDWLTLQKRPSVPVLSPAQGISDALGLYGRRFR